MPDVRSILTYCHELSKLLKLDTRELSNFNSLLRKRIYTKCVLFEFSMVVETFNQMQLVKST